MKQVVQDVRTGATRVLRIPDPLAPPGGVLVASRASLVSVGTERSVVELARRSLLGKARQRPDQVRRVLQKLRQEGLWSTAQQVMAKLDEPMPLGYSCAGVVVECGRGVQELKPGDRVAAAGPHAELVAVGRNLCARIPEGVGFEQAAYTSVAAIALQGVRLAQVGLGERVLVIGLGLVGQITVALLKAQGCFVLGTDPDPARLGLALELGADRVVGEGVLEAVRGSSGGRGVDAVLITAATESNAPIELAAEAARVRGRIVLVGVVGLQLPRPPFFAKELEFTVSFSLGPGRGDPLYEERGQDYPYAQARWTAQRNMEAVLGLMAAGKLPVEKLTTHRFELERVPELYDLITTRSEPHLGVLVRYAEGPRSRTLVLRSARPAPGTLGVSLIGAGNFARLVILPRLRSEPSLSLRGICTAKGMNAEASGTREGFSFATTEAAEVFADPHTAAVIVATRHDLHAELAAAALRAGKHVWVEKPLCIRFEELQELERLVLELGGRCPILMPGFNRRFAPATRRLRELFEGRSPLATSFRFFVPVLGREHWTQDEEVGGGRIVGEACHAIDACAAIAGSPPVRVFAESAARAGAAETTDDRVFLTLRHADGSVSSVSYQAGGDPAAPAERVEVVGGGRTALLDDWKELQVFAEGRRSRRRLSGDKGHAAELAAFLAACRSGGEWPIPWPHVLGTAWASLGAVRSLREGRAISIDEGAE